VPGAADAAAGPEAFVEVRVRYPETDRMQVAYHANYLVWFEIGRTELMRPTVRWKSATESPSR
jgi:YbgC/YbaW family acyl-CoA thioester hydrolase